MISWVKDIILSQANFFRIYINIAKLQYVESKYFVRCNNGYAKNDITYLIEEEPKEIRSYWRVQRLCSDYALNKYLYWSQEYTLFWNFRCPQVTLTYPLWKQSTVKYKSFCLVPARNANKKKSTETSNLISAEVETQATVCIDKRKKKPVRINNTDSTLVFSQTSNSRVARQREINFDVFRVPLLYVCKKQTRRASQSKLPVFPYYS